MPSVFLFIILLIYSMMFTFVFPYWKDIWLIYVNCALGFLSIFFWIISMCSDPGCIVKPHDIEFLVSFYNFNYFLSTEINVTCRPSSVMSRLYGNKNPKIKTL